MHIARTHSDTIRIQRHTKIMAKHKHTYVILIQKSDPESKQHFFLTGFLKKHDNPSKIRFICNQVLRERNAAHQHCNDEDAGRQILSHIRELGLRSPMMVYTPLGNISSTKYVQEYDMAGSVSGNYNVFHEYVSMLAKGTEDPGRWMRYNAWL